jgi:PAS domain-containing protein
LSSSLRRKTHVSTTSPCLRGERSAHQCEKRFIRDDGSVVRVLASLTFLRDDLGRPLSWVGQFQDVTARHAAEEALPESEERHRLVVRNLPGTAVVLYDRDLRCVLLEGRHIDDSGLTADDFIGRPLHEIATPDLREVVEPLMRQALEG